jgi:hypothetical protein
MGSNEGLDLSNLISRFLMNLSILIFGYMAPKSKRRLFLLRLRRRSNLLELRQGGRGVAVVGAQIIVMGRRQLDAMP